MRRGPRPTPREQDQVVSGRFVYSRHPATAAARSGVHDLWVVQADRCRAAVEAAFPDTAAEIYFNLGKLGRRVFADASAGDPKPLSPRSAWVVGPRAETLLIEKETRDCEIVGVRLRPGVARYVLGVPAAELRGRLVDLEDLWGGVVDEIRQRLAATDDPSSRAMIVEQAIVARLSRNHADADVRRIDALCAAVGNLSDTTIGGLADALGLTHRRVIALFDGEFGLKPKVFQRVQRLRQVLKSIRRQGRPNWSRIAASAGYFDQSHFIHDFRKLTGLTPAAYAAARMGIGDGSVPYRLAEGLG